MNQISTKDFFNFPEKFAVLKTILSVESFEFDIPFLALKKLWLMAKFFKLIPTITKYVMIQQENKSSNPVIT